MKRKRQPRNPPHIHTALEKELYASLMEANWRYAVLAASHEDQKNIALTTILALLAEINQSNLCDMERTRGYDLMRNECCRMADETDAADKALGVHRLETDAMLDALCHALTLNSNCCEYIGRVHDAHRTKLREALDCARVTDLAGTRYFRAEDWRKLEEMANEASAKS